ncbi:MAG: tRNA (N(6)-L-threonylcarbamoyladenosine(37)-C(2))-methylthiotransferase MtaB [Spirochaetaceae bacterium]|nr:MAG: tRNA (N(6)-L-threonylcarbamoyladenosine(37)-C(2))-methylthiotransferase MtaB [Spirochaetaceae bacterium]
MTAAFYTLGCKLNQSETESLAQAFKTAGFSVLPSCEKADIYIINTCTVTSKGDQKARKMVRQISRLHPEALVVITGCYAEVEKVELQNLFGPEHVAVVPQSRKSLITLVPGRLARADGFSGYARYKKYELFEQIIGCIKKEQSGVFNYNLDESLFHARAFLKIQDGCDGVCTYCRVPSARGQAVSLPLDLVLERISRLVANGFSEIVFTGVNISAFRHGKTGLANLLKRCIEGTKNARFRLSSLEPESLSQELAETCASPAVCPHFHIPIQSGSDRILGLMRRISGKQTIIDGISNLRQVRPNAFFGADIITGFPGETKEDFEETIKLVEELDLSRLHVFPFSPRPGTLAARMPDHIPEAEVRHRMEKLLAFSARQSESYSSSLMGKILEVVLERNISNGIWTGSAGEYVKCRISNVPTGDFRRKIVRAEVSGKQEPLDSRFISFTDVPKTFL